MPKRKPKRKKTKAKTGPSSHRPRATEVGSLKRRFGILVAAASLLVAIIFSLMAILPRVAQRAGTSEQTSVAPEENQNRDQELKLTAFGRTPKKADLDPRKDGWETEALADEVKHQLAELLLALDPHTAIDAAHMVGTLSADFRCTSLRPSSGELAYEDDVMTVKKSNGQETDMPHEGGDGLIEALKAMILPFSDSSEVHTHVKVVRVSDDRGRLKTRSLLEASGRSTTGSIEQHVTWDCDWVRGPEDTLKLSSIKASNFQETRRTGTWFDDCTESVLQHNPSFRQQLVYGLNHWLARIERARGLHVFARSGLAVGDVNGDGLDDLYVCQPGGLPNRLFIQNADGTAEDRSSQAGVDWLDHTSSALLVDLDNDNDQDLILAMATGLVAMANDGSGRFHVKTHLQTDDSDLQSLSAVDYDNDGDLDLYICIDFARLTTAESAFVYHDANDGGVNALFRNDIESANTWRFVDVTAAVGLGAHNRRHSLAASWEDYDNDGDQDLYVANDYGQNCLYRNDGGQFVEVADESGVIDFGSGMSVSWGDYDRDGWMDLYVGNMFSSAGNRITPQKQFKPGENDSTRATYGRFAKGNSLFRNVEGRFVERGAEAGVEMARWAWSSLFADLNNDGWQDLVVANGYITTEDTGDL